MYLGALVAGLRAGYIYNTWPLIDGALVPRASALFFDTPLWRNFFENALTVQFDHRMLAYAIFILALWHALDVARTVKAGPARPGAFVLAAAVALQVALGVATLLLQVPLAVALAHQGLAMLVLDRRGRACGECRWGTHCVIPRDGRRTASSRMTG